MRKDSEGAAFWAAYLAKSEANKGKSRARLLEDFQKHEAAIQDVNRRQAQALEEMEALLHTVEQLVQSGDCERSFYDSLIERHRVTQAALDLSAEKLERMARVVDGLSPEPHRKM